MIAVGAFFRRTKQGMGLAVATGSLLFAVPKAEAQENRSETVRSETVRTSPRGRDQIHLEFTPAQVQVLLPPPSAWPGQIVALTQELAPAVRTLRARIEASQKRPEFAEPVVLRLTTISPLTLIRQLGNARILSRANIPSTSKQTLSDFAKMLSSRVEGMRFAVEPSDLTWIDLEKLSQTLQAQTTLPLLQKQEWTRLVGAPTPEGDALRTHFGEHFRDAREKVGKFIRENPNAPEVPVIELLPDHFKKLIGRFSPLRGRNCFATALAFLDKNVEQMQNINLIREEGHHASMINNDEFMQALWLGYNELDAQEILAGLRFGDVVVFVDQAEGDSYLSLKHAAVHVAGQVYVHKQSKSASSPIEFTRWSDLAQTWTALAKQLDYRVFRRLPVNSLKSIDSKIAIEKIFWTQ